MAIKPNVCLNGIQILNVSDTYIYISKVPHEKKIRNMLALQNALEQVPWDQLHHAYGPATDTPDNLLNLLSPDTEVRECALGCLWTSICHQGSVYEASCAAVPFLIQILDQVPDEQKLSILYLLDGLSHRFWYAYRDQTILCMDSRIQVHQQWSIGQFLREGNGYHRPQWMAATHKAVSEGLAHYLPLLNSSHRETVMATLSLLSGFKEFGATCIPAIDALYSKTSDPFIQASVLLFLGPLLDIHSSLWERHCLLASGSRSQVHSLVWFAAVSALAHYQPRLVSGPMTAILLEVLVHAQPLDALFYQVSWGESHIYREACESLAHLGVPVGLQTLIAALSIGAAHWNILDTVRIIEALLDVAFFGDWVRDRYWNHSGNNPFSNLQIDEDGEHVSENALVSDPHGNVYIFYEGCSVPFVPGETDFSIKCCGYDKQEAEKLRSRYEKEGSAAFTSAQRQALEALLNCDPFWQTPIELLQVYGLPTAKEQLAQLLGK